MIRELTKEEGRSFLKLVYLAINSDSVVFDEEKAAFEGYVKKLGLDETLDSFSSASLEETLSEVNTYELRKKKIIFTEILGVLYSDEIFDEEETDFVNTIGNELGFSEADVWDMENAVVNYLTAYKALIDIVSE